MIDQNTISLINEKTDIVSLVSEFVSLEKAGKNYRGLCPFHNEKTPSFSVSPEKNIAVCMSCKEGGSPITFFSKIKNISFLEAVTILGERAGIHINSVAIDEPHKTAFAIMNKALSFFRFNLENSKSGQEAIKYLQKRGLDNNTISHFNIGFAPKGMNSLYRYLTESGFKDNEILEVGLITEKNGKYYDFFTNRIVFPVTTSNSKVIGFSARAIEESDTKYLNSPETKIFKKSDVLYNFNETLQDIRKSKRVYLFEGFFDCISAYLAGINNGIATMGTALTIAHSKLLKSVTSEVVIVYDGDNAGKSATVKAIPFLKSQGLKVSVIVIPNKKDPDDYIREKGRKSFLELISKPVDSYQFIYDYYKENKDFNGAGDREIFIKEIKNAFKNTPEEVKAFYSKKLNEEFGMNQVFDIDVPKETRPRKPDKISSRGQKAEIGLIIALYNEPSFCSLIESEIEILKDFKEDELNKDIISKLLYDIKNNEFNKISFTDKLSQTEKIHFEGVILKDMANTIVNWEENVIQKYISALKDNVKNRQKKAIKDKIKEEKDPIKKIEHRKKIDQINKGEEL